VQEHGGVFAPGKEEYRTFALGDDLSENEESVRLKDIKMVGGVRGVQDRGHVSVE
jgi:hypothetical protein